jgi:glutamate---cysteine ligase / carboxylate-amine ligase
MPVSRVARWHVDSGELGEACPPWARWNGALDRRYTVGVEEELMLLEPESCSLAPSCDDALERLSRELSMHASPETHAAVIELRTGIHTDVRGAVGELTGLRRLLGSELDALGLSVAGAGTHPMTVSGETAVSAAPRYRLLDDTLRSLAHREPTMALHVHVGVPDPEEAIRLVNALRANVPLLIALSANSPFWQARDSGFDSMRTVIFHAFPRTGLPRHFESYEDYVDALGPVIGAGAVPDPSFFWWDVRPQPRLGTVEVRAMDAQTTVAEVAPLVALIQSLALMELEGDPPPPVAGAEVLAENRFLAARDGMDAQLIDPGSGRLVPLRETVHALLTRSRPYAQALGCEGELEGVHLLADSNGAQRQRGFAAAHGPLDRLVSNLADRFLATERSG